MSFLIEQLTANGGTGSPITLGRVVASKAIFDFITRDSVTGITVNAGGNSYVVGETFDIDIPGSPGEFFKARGVVTQINSDLSPQGSPLGAATQVKIVSGGAYDDIYARGLSPEGQVITGVPTSNASASGTGLTVDVTPEESHWTEQRGFGAQSPLPATDYVDGNTDFEWICTSKKSTNPPTIGLKTNVATGNGYAYGMTATGFDKTQLWGGQPGRSPDGTSQDQPRLLMPGQDPQIYVSSTERRVNIMIRDGNFMHYGVIGLFIPFTDTEANYPFPGIVATTTTGALLFQTSMIRDNGANPAGQLSGIVNAMTLQTGTWDHTPYVIRSNLGPTWESIGEDTLENANIPHQIWPQISDEAAADYNYAPQVNSFTTNPFNPSTFQDGITNENSWFGSNDGTAALGRQGVAPLGLQNRLSFGFQVHIIKSQTNDTQLIGIVDGYIAVHGRGLTAFEEVIQPSGKRYIVSPDCNTSNLWRWIGMEITVDT